MFLRHISLMFVFALVGGCSCGMSHTRPPETDSGFPTADASLPPGVAMARLIRETPAPLVMGENRVIGVHLWSTGAPIAVMKIVFHLYAYRGDTVGDPGWGMGNFRLMLGDEAVTLPLAEVFSAESRVSDAPRGFGQVVIVRFTRELLIDARGSDFVLFGEVVRGELMPGDSLDPRFHFGEYVDPHCPNQGMLTPSYPVTERRVFGPDIYTDLAVRPCVPPIETAIVAGDCAQTTYAAFLWSPRTSSSHSDRDCASGGSDDWFTGGFTDDPDAVGSHLVSETLVY